MRRACVVLLVGCLFTSGHAQERRGYIGLGISYATYTGVEPNYPLPSLQVGGPITDTLELRGTLESILIVSNLGLDLLYPIGLEEELHLYVGGGGNLRFFAYYPNGFDLRGIFGGEYRLSSEGVPSSLFAEVRLYLRGLFAGFPPLEGRAGINFPF